MLRPLAIQKELSRNDTGETGGHQAGILIPKKKEILSFFPVLDASTKNPRLLLTFNDFLGGQWFFSFIYYNNRYFGGTRNEYRLTGMTKFFYTHGLRAGDVLTLSRDDSSYFLGYTKKREAPESTEGNLKLGNSWKVIKF